MKIFNLDILTLNRLALPAFLHTESVLSIIDAATSPLRFLLQRFSDNRHANLYRLDITPQVISLEKLLNDRYDDELRRITIVDGELKERFIFRVIEQQPLWLRTAGETQSATPLYNTGEGGFIGASFIIQIPTGLEPQTNKNSEMNTIIKVFKLVGRNFKIMVSG